MSVSHPSAATSVLRAPHQPVAIRSETQRRTTITRFQRLLSTGVEGLRRRQADVGKALRLEGAGADGLLQGLELGTCFHLVVDACRIEESPDRVGGEVRRRAHEFTRLRPI